MTGPIKRSASPDLARIEAADRRPKKARRNERQGDMPVKASTQRANAESSSPMPADTRARKASGSPRPRSMALPNKPQLDSETQNPTRQGVLKSDGETKLRLRWLDKAPILKVSPEVATEKAWALYRHLEEKWGPVETSDTDEIDEGDWKIPKRTHQQRWNDRLSSMSELMENFGLNDLAECDCHISTVDGVCTSWMTSDPTNGPVVYINEIMTHSGSAKQLGILLEFALEHLCRGTNSEKQIKVSPVDGDAYHAFKSMGFVDDPTEAVEGDFPNQVLIPQKAREKWLEHEGQWRLKRHLNQPIIG